MPESPPSPDRSPLAEELLVEALRAEAARRELSRVLLIGMQACATIRAVNALAGGSDRVALLQLDRAAGGVGCGLGNRERFLGNSAPGWGGDGPGSPGVADASPAARTIGDDGTFAAVALNVVAARSYRLLREIVEQTARYVAQDGVVLAAGPRKGGAEVAARTLRDRFERVTVLAYRKGERVYRADRPRAADNGSGEAERTASLAIASSEESIAGPGRARRADDGVFGPASASTVVLRGREIRLLHDDRLFARGRLDPATRMLAEAFEVPPGAAVLDLGSGSGVLGILAALLEPTCRVWLVDSDPLAVAASGQNAALNGVADAVAAHLSDVLRDLPGQTFDVVLTNPPFHQGRRPDRSLAERFVREAGAALRPGGRVYVVCNRFLRYEPLLEWLVGPTREIAGDRRYKVLLARPPLAGVAPGAALQLRRWRTR